MRARVLVLFIVFITAGACAQCPKERDESLETLKDQTIRKEVGSLYESPDHLPTKGVRLLRIKGRSKCMDRADFNGQGVRVTITSAPFDSSAHQLTFDGDTPFICAIDGRSFHGTDGGLPSRAIKRITLTVDSTSIPIPRAAWSDLYQPNFCYSPVDVNGIEWECHVARSIDRRRVYIHMSNSDGAGSYDVVWIIVDGKYLRRMVEHSC